MAAPRRSTDPIAIHAPPTAASPTISAMVPTAVPAVPRGARSTTRRSRLEPVPGAPRITPAPEIMAIPRKPIAPSSTKRPVCRSRAARVTDDEIVAAAPHIARGGRRSLLLSESQFPSAPSGQRVSLVRHGAPFDDVRVDRHHRLRVLALRVGGAPSRSGRLRCVSPRRCGDVARSRLVRTSGRDIAPAVYLSTRGRVALCAVSCGSL